MPANFVPFAVYPRPEWGDRCLPTAPPFPASVPQVVLDTSQGPGWSPRTLFVSCFSQLAEWNAQRELDHFPAAPLQAAVAPGMVVLELTGLLTVGSYFRRFDLGCFDSFRFPIETFKGIRVKVLDQTGQGFGVVAILTDELALTTTPPELYLATNDAAGRYLVPPGAVSMIPQDPDPLFNWITLRPDQDEQVISEPAWAGAPLEVRGPAYTTHVSPFRVSWRIRL